MDISDEAAPSCPPTQGLCDGCGGNRSTPDPRGGPCPAICVLCSTRTRLGEALVAGQRSAGIPQLRFLRVDHVFRALCVHLVPFPGVEPDAYRVTEYHEGFKSPRPIPNS